MSINYKLYHPEWFSRIRPVLLARSNYKCESCGMRAGTFYHNGIRDVKIILTLSHQNHDINDNSYTNLKCLCLGCHMKYDRNKHLSTISKNKARKYGSQLKFNFI